ncbi:MAG: Rieske 2Fe-2S domain-containing protein [Bacteroidota bacterium]
MKETDTPITRTAFLKSLGLSGAALMSIYCLGGLTSACTNKTDEPAPQTIPNPPSTPLGGKTDFTLDLAAPANSALASDGGFMYQNNIIIAKVNSSTFVALSKVCTHQGTTVTFEAANNRFHCDNHGSNFSTTGSVINGPAASSLKQYNTTLTDNSLRVFEA